MGAKNGRIWTNKINCVRPDHLRRYVFALQWITNKISPEATILDAACGIGYGSNVLGGGGATVTGIDHHAPAIEFGKEHWVREGGTLVCGDILKADGDFDAVVSFETLEHVTNAPEVVRHFAKRARWLIASVPNEVMQPFANTGHPDHKRHYTPDQFTGLFEDNGFSVRERYCQKSKAGDPPARGVDGRTIIYIGERTQS